MMRPSIFCQVAPVYQFTASRIMPSSPVDIQNFTTFSASLGHASPAQLYCGSRTTWPFASLPGQRVQ